MNIARGRNHKYASFILMGLSGGKQIFTVVFMFYIFEMRVLFGMVDWSYL